MNWFPVCHFTLIAKFVPEALILLTKKEINTHRLLNIRIIMTYSHQNIFEINKSSITKELHYISRISNLAAQYWKSRYL